VYTTYSVLHFVLHNEIHSAAFDVTDSHIPMHTNQMRVLLFLPVFSAVHGARQGYIFKMQTDMGGDIIVYKYL